jgi:hypothetical protein
MLLLVWVYFETLAIQRNNELVALRNDTQTIGEVLNRFVLPRHLTDNQIQIIAGSLKPLEPQNFDVEYSIYDEEARQYAAEIQKALEFGGWHLKSPIPIPIGEHFGLSIPAEITPSHMQSTNVDKQPNMILRNALAIANVQLDGSIGLQQTSNQNITEDRVHVVVGHRRRDSYVLPAVR